MNATQWLWIHTKLYLFWYWRQSFMVIVFYWTKNIDEQSPLQDVSTRILRVYRGVRQRLDVIFFAWTLLLITTTAFELIALTILGKYPHLCKWLPWSVQRAAIRPPIASLSHQANIRRFMLHFLIEWRCGLFSLFRFGVNEAQFRVCPVSVSSVTIQPSLACSLMWRRSSRWNTNEESYWP